MSELTPAPFPAAIDNTMRSLYVLCPRKFFYEFILQRAPSAINVDLEVGACYARALEVTRKAYFGGGVPSKEAILLGARELLRTWPEIDTGNSPKSIDRVLGAFGYYFTVFPLDTEYFTPLILPSGRPAVEFSFTLPLPIRHPETGDPLIYCGRFDQLVQHRDGGIWVEDDKTTKQLGASWASKWRMRSQFTGYTWAAREYGYDCQGALVRGLAIRKTGFDHAEHLTSRPKHMIETWYVQLLNDVQKMIADYENGQWDQRFADACDMYGGCGFQDVCASGNPDLWLEDFPKRVWEPAKPMETW